VRPVPTIPPPAALRFLSLSLIVLLGLSAAFAASGKGGQAAVSLSCRMSRPCAVFGLHGAGIRIGLKLKPPLSGPNSFQEMLPISGLGGRTGQMHLVRCSVLFDSFK
jgi:hypothetical protein